MSEIPPINVEPSAAVAEDHPADALDKTKAVLIALLKANGIARVTAEYDGGGDSGQINAITAQNEAGQPIDVSALGPFSHGERTFDTIHEFIDEFAWDCIEASEHSGFFNNEGGYGEFKFDVATGRVWMEHTDFITDSVYSETEF